MAVWGPTTTRSLSCLFPLCDDHRLLPAQRHVRRLLGLPGTRHEEADPRDARAEVGLALEGVAKLREWRGRKGEGEGERDRK
jgi:hypothetical protein